MSFHSDSALGYDVVLDHSNEIPLCPHGPTLLFQRTTANKAGQRFFACSACRDRKDCNFFQLEDEKVSEVRRKAHKVFLKSQNAPFTHKEFSQRFKLIQSLNEGDRKLCQTCGYLILPAEFDRHKEHTLKSYVSNEEIKRPTKLLPPLENNKKEAQYLFSDKTVKFLVESLKSLGFNRILCVGAPRIHEYIVTKEKNMSALLMDIDFRYEQFYDQNNFCRYNMFNHHFFDGPKAERVYRDFIGGKEGHKHVVILDPPFGGFIQPIAHSLKKILADYSQGKKKAQELPVLWIFPYFMQPKISENLTSLVMLDYKMEYDNHPLFGSKEKGKKKGSPVRIFTNIDPSKFTLMEQAGYRFCEPCRRYVAPENQHCKKCNDCTSKNGRTYQHCEACSKCVKPSWVHCGGCNKCALPEHPCRTDDQPTVGCYVCGEHTHKKRHCPQLRKEQRSKGLKRKRDSSQSKQKNGVQNNNRKKKKRGVANRK